MASSANCRCPGIKSIYVHHRHSVFLYFHSLRPLYLLGPALPQVWTLRLRVEGVRESRSSLAFAVLGAGSAGGVADDVREAGPPDQRGAAGDHQQALQGRGVVGHVGAARQPPFGDVVYDRDAGTGLGVGVGAAPAVPPDGWRGNRGRINLTCGGETNWK